MKSNLILKYLLFTHLMSYLLDCVIPVCKFVFFVVCLTSLCDCRFIGRIVD